MRNQGNPEAGSPIPLRVRENSPLEGQKQLLAAGDFLPGEAPDEGEIAPSRTPLALGEPVEGPISAESRARRLSSSSARRPASRRSPAISSGVKPATTPHRCSTCRRLDASVAPHAASSRSHLSRPTARLFPRGQPPVHVLRRLRAAGGTSHRPRKRIGEERVEREEGRNELDELAGTDAEGLRLFSVGHRRRRRR